MSSNDNIDEVDSAEESESSLLDGNYTKESTPSSESCSSYSDHSEMFVYDEKTGEYTVEDYPAEVWQEHYDFKSHHKKDTCYTINGDPTQQWHVIDMISEPDDVVEAHLQACDQNQKFIYGDEQFTSAKGVTGVSGCFERPDRRLRTTFSIASKHFHGIPPGIRNRTNPRIYVSAMQFGNLTHVVELDATVTISPGMLAYVEGDGWCIIQNITAYNEGRQR